MIMDERRSSPLFAFVIFCCVLENAEAFSIQRVGTAKVVNFENIGVYLKHAPDVAPGKGEINVDFSVDTFLEHIIKFIQPLKKLQHINTVSNVKLKIAYDVEEVVLGNLMLKFDYDITDIEEAEKKGHIKIKQNRKMFDDARANDIRELFISYEEENEKKIDVDIVTKGNEITINCTETDGLNICPSDWMRFSGKGSSLIYEAGVLGKELNIEDETIHKMEFTGTNSNFDFLKIRREIQTVDSDRVTDKFSIFFLGFDIWKSKTISKKDFYEVDASFDLNSRAMRGKIFLQNNPEELVVPCFIFKVSNELAHFEYTIAVELHSDNESMFSSTFSSATKFATNTSSVFCDNH